LGAVILAISASTSFAFFYNYFSNLIPPGIMGADVASLISGIVGTLLFDVAAVVWLQTYLNDARTPEQRAISLIMLIITFTGAAAASVAHLSLSATGELALDASTLDSIATVALVTVIIGVIANFGSTIAYQRFSYDNKQAVREADREDEIQKAEDGAANELDALVSQKLKERLTQIAPTLAADQAARIAAQYQRREAAKYGSTDAGKTAVAPTPPQGQSAARNTYGSTDNGILKPSKKYGLSRKGHMVDESDDIEVLIRNPAYDFDAYIVDRNGTVITDLDRERATRPTPAPRQAQSNGRVSHNEAGLNYPNGNPYSPE
jgi:hypothetical protein